MRKARLADLDVVLAGGSDREGGGTGPMLVLLHGYGAPGDDLVPLSRQLAMAPGVRFAFPAAPHAVSGMPAGAPGRAWWQLDMLDLQRAALSGDYESLTRRVPEGVAEARGLIEALLDTLEKEHSVPRSGLVLGGFSQGAMLATDVTLRAEKPAAGLVILSGTLLSKDEWLPLMPGRAGLPVLQSHGRADPILAYPLAEQLHQALSAAGIPVEFHAFNGGHAIPGGALDALSGFVSRAIGQQAAS